jgi:hypothetical protein
MAYGPNYPVQLELQGPLKVPRWLPLISWLLVLPQLIVLYVLLVALGILQLVAFFTILITAKIPKGIFDVMALALRYSWRVTSYGMFMRSKYPPFEFTPSNLDPGTDPAMMSVDYPAKLSRLLIFVKWLLVIPHIIVLAFLWIGAAFAVLIAFFAVLITGRWPQGLRNYMVGVNRWGTRVNAYWYFMTDKYPPFRLGQ